MKHTINTAVVAVCLYQSISCGGGPPTARMAATCAAVDGSVYVFGGIPRSGSATSIVEQYAPTPQIWSRKASMPTARAAAASAVLGKRVYVFGGRNESGILDVVESYDVTSDSWATEPRLPSPVWNAMAAVADDKIYLFGGLVGTGDQRASIDVVNVFDSVRRTWTAGPRMPQPKQGAAVAVLEGKIHIIAGMIGSGGRDGSVTSTVHVFDPEAGRWDTAEPLLIPRTGVGAAVIDGVILVAGGGRAGEVTDTTETYDPRINVWRAGPRLRKPRGGHCVQSVGARILVIGGSNVAATTAATADVEEISWKR